uniref:PEP-CTERM/exosortase system-associated acyltransferase n=1 Tax=Ningiella ruwaisensis TaxID=2364274 RepID=UPI00109F9C63|nr:PEP-CTERM/exosortase system-associated acyltransferase [Ningiella ruwaisensis]
MDYANTEFPSQKMAFKKPAQSLKRVLKPIKFYIKSRTVAKTFFNYFDVRSELSESEKEAMYALRHKVYCEELGFRFASHANKESDIYDNHSRFCIVKHTKSKKLVGAVRLVESFKASEKLPIEDTCNTFYDDCHCLPHHFKREEIAEVSRLVVTPEYRKNTFKNRASAKHLANISSFGDLDAGEFTDKHELRNFKYIAVALYLGAMVLSQRTKRKHLFIITTPKLAQSLACFGIQLTRIGYAFEYQGYRAPYYIDVSKTEKRIHGGFKRLLRVIQTSML